MSENNFIPLFFPINVDLNEYEYDFLFSLYKDEYYNALYNKAKEILVSNHSCIDALNIMGCSYAIHKQYEKSLKYFKKALTLLTQNHEKTLKKCCMTYVSSGIINLKILNSAEALSNFKQSLSFIPNYQTSLEAIHYIENNYCKMPDSLAKLNDEIFDKQHINVNNLSSMFDMFKKSNTKHLQRCTEGMANIHCNKANVYFLEDNLDLAHQEFNIALELSENKMLRALKGRATIHYKRKNKIELKKDCLAILEISPNNEFALRHI